MLVRVNPIDDETPEEINKVIELGADIVMLPYFKTIDEIKNFLSIVNNRVKTCLLLETKEAVEILDDILKLEGIDEIHIGLNDLHLSYNMNFMFELLADGTVEKICNKIKKTNIKYGFGGVGRVGEQVMLPAENIIAEHYRLNSSMVILGRSFCDTSKIIDINELQKIFEEGIKKMREYEQKMTNQDYDFFVNNHEIIIKKVNEIVNITKNKKRGSNTK